MSRFQEHLRRKVSALQKRCALFQLVRRAILDGLTIHIPILLKHRLGKADHQRNIVQLVSEWRVIVFVVCVGVAQSRPRPSIARRGERTQQTRCCRTQQTGHISQRQSNSGHDILRQRRLQQRMWWRRQSKRDIHYDDQLACCRQQTPQEKSDQVSEKKRL